MVWKLGIAYRANVAWRQCLVAATLGAVAIAGASPAAAQSQSSNIVFSFLNERPNGEVVTGHVVNRRAFAEVPANGTATITSVFGYV